MAPLLHPQGDKINELISNLGEGATFQVVGGSWTPG